MAKYVKQFRYYGVNNPKNYPPGTTYAALVNGNIFSDYSPIVSLGIQSAPDLKFYINDSEYGAMVGKTGIFELDIDGITTIASIRIDETSLRNIDEVNSEPLMIDIIYEGGS